ncbi:MAG: OmpH family outer membrane protein [Vicingaceae bacterium]
MNKNLQIALNVVFALAIAYLFFTQNQKKCSEGQLEETLEEQITEAVDEPLQVRYVNSDSIWSKYDFVSKMRDNLAQKQEEYRSDLERRLTTFEKEVMEFQQNAQTMSQFEGQEKQKELIAKEQELSRLQEDLSVKLMEMEDKMKRDLRKNILTYLKRYRNEKVDVILDFSTNSSVLMIDDSLNLTQEVLNGLNEEYKQKNSEK